MIQKDLCASFAREVKEVIKKKIGEKPFSILIDESRNISIAEQMAVVAGSKPRRACCSVRVRGLRWRGWTQKHKNHAEKT
jgi:transcriptional regulator